MTVEIRTIDPGEAEAWFASLGSAFLERFDPGVGAEVRDVWDFRRVWAAIDDGVIVGTARSWATELTLPGGTRLPAAAVTAVTVRPTHRRRGLLSRMLAADHAAARERGEALSVLHASEFPIYGRFGYGSAAPWATWTWDRRASGMLHPGDPGRMELAEPSESTRDLMVGVYEAWRLRQPGELRRRAVTWEWDLGLRGSAIRPPWKGWVALHRDAGGSVDGYVRYHAEEKWEQRQSRTILHVDDLHGLDPSVEDALWGFLGGIDLVVTVRSERRRVAERLPWLLVNARAADASEVGDALWVRIGDLPTALATRGWERSGSLVLEVVGRGGGRGGGRGAPAGEERTRVLLDATPDGATCRPTRRAPDLTLPLGAVGAALLGGTRLRDVVLSTGADEHQFGALAAADRLFATLDAPWCSTFF